MQTLNHDWYHILQVIYYRHTLQSLSVSANGFKSFYGGIVNYERVTNDAEFVLHCELKLILSLTELHPPTVLGISKACCSLCYEYIQSLNKSLQQNGRPTWLIGGKHQKCYLWACPNNTSAEVKVGLDAVRKWVENRILAMLEKCQQKLSFTESPSQRDDDAEQGDDSPMELW